MGKKEEEERKGTDILSSFGPCSLASCTPHLPSVLLFFKYTSVRKGVSAFCYSKGSSDQKKG